MNLLFITNNPSRPSFRQRVEVHLETLRNNGVDCHVAGLPLRELERLKLFKQAAEFDCVFLQKKCLNFFDALCLRKFSRKIIYDFDDAVMYSPKKPDGQATSHFRLFRRTARFADLVIAGNSYLARHALKFNPDVEILPTGLDTKTYRVKAKPSGDGKVRLVWIGSKSTLGYLEDIKPALEEVGSRFNNVVLRIICDGFFDLENMAVEKCIWSLENQAKYLATADVGLAPLPDNRFTRGKCGFKILQYQAAHLPVITSPVGVNAEYVTDGITGYLASDNNQWVDRISELIEDAELRKQMADASQGHVEKFDIGTTGTKLCELLTEFIERTKTTGIHSITTSIIT